MKVCLVNPPPFAIQEPMYDTPIFVRPSLACLAATLREAGVECHLIDAKFERLSNRQVMDRIADFKPQVVGHTAFTNEIKPAAELAALVKKQWPEVVNVAGGAHLTALARETMEEFPAFDVGCIGQGDLTIVELCRALDEQRSLDTVQGLIWRDGEQLHRTMPAPPPVYGELPEPAWDLMPAAARYHVMTARGCPFKCNFCLNPNGRIVTDRSAEQVVAEIEGILERFDPRDPINIWFDNEIFTVKMDVTHELCDAIIDAGLHERIGWFNSTHVNVVDRDLLAKMKRAGCKRIGLGIETGDDGIFKEMGKGITVERAWKACRMAAEVGVPVESYFIIGHPNETVESAKKSIDMAVKINPEIPIFGIMVPYPGTEVARKAQAGEDGYRLLSTDWNDYNKQIGGAVEFEHLTRFQLEWLQITGYLRVFWANRRWRDLAAFIWTYRQQGLTVLKKWFLGGLSNLRKRATVRGRETGPLRSIYSGHIHDDNIVARLQPGPKRSQAKAKPDDHSLPVLGRSADSPSVG